MAHTGFCEPGDLRLNSTIDAIIDELLVEEALVYRYSGQQDQEGAFWLFVLAGGGACPRRTGSRGRAAV